MMSMMPEPSAGRARMGHRDETVSRREDDSGTELSGAQRSTTQRSRAKLREQSEVSAAEEEEHRLPNHRQD